MIQGDVFCFTKLEEALIEVNFVIEAVHEDLEDKKSLLESKTIITLGSWIKRYTRYSFSEKNPLYLFLFEPIRWLEFEEKKIFPPRLSEPTCFFFFWEDY